MYKLQIFQQCGNNTIWNIRSYQEDKAGDGLIISPSDYAMEKVKKISQETRENSVFDPQFYLPRSNKEKLKSYDFFPNTFLENDYNTNNYEKVVYEVAYNCVKFQADNKFKCIIIPCKYLEVFTDKSLEYQKEMYIMPFLTAIKQLKIKKDIFLTLIVKTEYLFDEDIKRKMLNFATSFPSIIGIYLVPEHQETYKRFRDEGYIVELMKFISQLTKTGMHVHLGYTDIEGFIFSLANISSVSIGTYENTKNFQLGKFQKREKNEMQGPKPRLFSSSLLQNVEYTYLYSLKINENMDELFDEDKYRALMFEPTYKWHFTKPEIYRYYLKNYSNLLRELPNEYEERKEFIMNKIDNGLKLYKKISDDGILLDEKSNGEHLTHWKNAVVQFDKEFKKGE